MLPPDRTRGTRTGVKGRAILGCSPAPTLPSPLGILTWGSGHLCTVYVGVVSSIIPTWPKWFPTGSWVPLGSSARGQSATHPRGTQEAGPNGEMASCSSLVTGT